MNCDFGQKHISCRPGIRAADRDAMRAKGLRRQMPRYQNSAHLPILGCCFPNFANGFACQICFIKYTPAYRQHGSLHLDHNKMIEEPHVVTTIPEGLYDKNDDLTARVVYGLSDSGIRERSEIALAINRQGISIYDVCSHTDDARPQYL